MSLASHALGRLNDLYHSLLARMRAREARLADPLAGRAHFCGVEQLEPRLLLSVVSLPSEYTPLSPTELQVGLFSDGAAADLIRLDEVRSDPRFSAIDGGGYSVVVIDSGIDLDHPFFGNDSDSDGIADRIAYNFDFSGDNDADASDTIGHGSNVAGIIGSASGSYLGVAPAVDIIALKVFPDNEHSVPIGDMSRDLEEALSWVVDNHASYNIVAVNLSLGDGNYASPSSAQRIYSDELSSLIDSGVAVVAAAGNSFHSPYNSAEGLAAPAVFSNVISVGAVFDGDYGAESWLSGAVDHSSGADRIVSFSQRHETELDVLAPGAKITSANWNGSTVTMSGTSQAAPHVAGLVALMQDAANAFLGRSLSVSELTSILTLTGTSINDGDDEDDNVTNTGPEWNSIDAFAALDFISDYSGVNQDPVLSNAGVSPTTGSGSTTFAYAVDYFDADGDAPSVADLYIDGIRHSTSRTAGTPANGTYGYSTTLGEGSHNFFFSFQDGRGGTDMTPIYGGPTVVPEGETAAQFWFGGGGGVPLSEDFGVKYSVDGGTTQLLPGDTLEHPGVFRSFATPCTLRLEGWTASDNHEFREWAIHADGSLVTESTAQILELSISACNELSIATYWGYTPQYYTLGGAVTNAADPVSGAEITIEGIGFSDSVVTGGSGTYSFAGVPGGVPYVISAEHADYTFAPPNVSIPNLTEPLSNCSFIAVNSDDVNPIATLVTVPEDYVGSTGHVSFSWSGSDNKTAPGSLEYRYRLLGSADESWSDWASGTSRDYDLPNGAYRFEVVARDEAGNVSTFGDAHAFALSASPRVTSVELIDNGIWLGAMELAVPAGDTDPSNAVVIQSDQFGLAGEGFVPVRLLSSDGQTVYGTIDYATEELSLPGIVEKTDVGFLVTLPTPITGGETAEYLVQWGYDVQLGWGDANSVPYQSPVSSSDNYEYDLGSYLTTNGKHLRLRAGRQAMVPGGYSATYNASVGLHTYDTNTGVIAVEPIDFEAADYYSDGASGYYGTAWWYLSTGTCFLETDDEVWVFWRHRRYTRDQDGASRHGGFGFRRFDRDTMLPIGDVVCSPLIEDARYGDPTLSTDGSIWMTGTVGEEQLVYSKLDASGQILLHGQTVATHPGGLAYPSFTERGLLPVPGGRMAFFYARRWEASATNSESRRQVYVKILDAGGSVVLDETALAPELVGPEIEDYDNREFSWNPIVVDDVGRLWVSVSSDGASGTHHYYSIVNSDGTFFKNMVEIPAPRQFRFLDADGLVWAKQAGELFMLDGDDSIVGGPFTGSPMSPNQGYEPGAASVGVESYRLFDRWSSQVVSVEIGSDTRVGQMELVDTDEFDQEAHVRDLDISWLGGNVISIPGTAPAVSYADMNGVLSPGTTGLTFSQNNVLGGEILISFTPDFSVDPPDISVWDGTNEVIDGQTTAIDLGAIQQGGPGPSRTFTILNDGEEPLTLTVPFADPTHFIVSEPGQTTLGAGESTTFTATLKTDAAWSGSETVSFGSNDADENPFDFPVSGKVVVTGDFDGDDFVGQSDMDMVLLHWGSTGGAPEGWVYDQPGVGDLIGQSYLDKVLLHWGNGTPPAGSAAGGEATGVLALSGQTEETEVLSASSTPEAVRQPAAGAPLGAAALLWPAPKARDLWGDEAEAPARIPAARHAEPAVDLRPIDLLQPVGPVAAFLARPASVAEELEPTGDRGALFVTPDQHILDEISPLTVFRA